MQCFINRKLFKKIDVQSRFCPTGRLRLSCILETCGLFWSVPCGRIGQYRARLADFYDFYLPEGLRKASVRVLTYSIGPDRTIGTTADKNIWSWKLFRYFFWSIRKTDLLHSNPLQISVYWDFLSLIIHLFLIYLFIY